MQRSEQINEIAAAMSKAQGEITTASKDSTNPHFRSNYADLASVWRACRDQLAANGVAVVQGVEYGEKGVTVTTLLAHASGQWIQDSLDIPCDKPTAHAIGSACTYGRRFSLAAMVGVAPDDDDDGNAASNGQTKPAVVPLTKEELAIVAECNDMMEAAKSPEDLSSLGAEVFSTKPYRIKAEIKPRYDRRMEALKAEAEDNKSLEVAAAAAK